MRFLHSTFFANGKFLMSVLLPEQVASHVVDRAADVARFFPLTLDLGCGRSHIAMATTSDVTGCLVQCDMAENALVHEYTI